jgi:multiple sugar transport system substrate-binding protein
MKLLIFFIVITVCFFSILVFSCAQNETKSDFNPNSITGLFQWDRAAGQTIKLSLNKHPFTESLIPSLNDFTKLTGIKVDYNVLSEEEYRDKIIIELSSGGGSVDVFMTGPFTSWSYVYAGWLEPLDSYLDNSSLVEENYDLDDFFPALITGNRWNGKPGYQNYGKGTLWSIPVQVETYILAYRKDWAEELNLIPPRNYRDFYNFAHSMTRKIDGEQVYGITSRGLGTWPTISTGFISGFASYGCRDFDAQMKCRINTPQAVEFTSLWMKTIKDCGPLTWSNNTWYDAKEQFESGRYGMILDCDFFASSYENQAKSRISGKLAYASPPAGPDGTIRSNIWTWALSINKNSQHKLASWLFLQWATSKEQLLNAVFKGNWNPARQSVWNNPQIINIHKQMGNYRQVVEKNLQKHVKICWTPQPQVSAVGDRWARALHDIWTGADPKEILDKTAQDIDRIIQRAGINLKTE